MHHKLNHLMMWMMKSHFKLITEAHCGSPRVPPFVSRGHLFNLWAAAKDARMTLVWWSHHLCRFDSCQPTFYRRKSMYEKLFRQLCSDVNRTPEEIRSRRRNVSLVADRWTIARILRDKGLSFPAIGIIMNRDHSSIQHAVNPEVRAKREKSTRIRRQKELEERHLNANIKRN